MQLLRITFPYIVFISLVALSAGILNTWSRFAVPAITPALLNVAFIVGAVFFAERFDPPVLVLAWAVFVGGLLQLAFQVPFLAQARHAAALALRLSQHPGVRRVLRLMVPAAFGVSVSQVSLLINQIFASFLATGSVSWLYYADRLMELPAGCSASRSAPSCCRACRSTTPAANAAEYSQAARLGPAPDRAAGGAGAAALAVLALPLVATLFHYGRFGAEDAWMTRQALVAYSVGLVGMILVKILAPGLLRAPEHRTPVKIGIVTLVVTQVDEPAFVGPLQHAGLALAIGLGACLNALLLYLVPEKAGDLCAAARLAGCSSLKVARPVAADGGRALSLAMGAAAWWLQAGWQLQSRRRSWAWSCSARRSMAPACSRSASGRAISRAARRTDGRRARGLRAAHFATRTRASTSRAPA